MGGRLGERVDNAQGELSPLERGLHALAATEKGKHGRSVAAYAEEVGRPQPTVAKEVMAARFAQSYSTCNNLAELQPYARHLAEIHAAPAWLRPARLVITPLPRQFPAPRGSRPPVTAARPGRR